VRLCLKTEPEAASKMCFFKNVDGGQSPKRKKIVSVKFSHAVFCLLDFFTLEDGTDILFQNVG
jgi:hypothetical protein